MRLPDRGTSSLLRSQIGWRHRHIFRRQDSPNSTGNNLWILGVVAGIIVVVAVAFVLIRVYRKKGKLPTFSKKRGAYQHTDTAHAESSSGVTATGPSGRQSASRSTARGQDGSASETSRNRDSVATTVDRNTSVRSVMTLPAYRHNPNEHERVLGREGERDGVDRVVELPTLEDEEAMRDEEMEALYQIRVARRREIADREERRRLRREARARGDTVALAELNERARAASNSTTIDDLRTEHSRIKQSRHRAVSSVSYADLGVARHDGTRIRNSGESERVGLLSDAASISNSLTAHRRARSSGSVISLESTNENYPSPGPTRSGATTPRLATQQSAGSVTAGSSPEIIGEADLGDSMMPRNEPPGYEDVSLDDDGGSETTATNTGELPPDYTTWDQNDPRLRDAINAVNALNRMESSGDVSSGSEGEGRSARSSPRTGGGVPRLPSLRIAQLPQIVVQPSSAHPSDLR